MSYKIIQEWPGTIILCDLLTYLNFRNLNYFVIRCTKQNATIARSFVSDLSSTIR